MDSKQILLIKNKNLPQNQIKADNINCNTKFADQNKNLNESMITTSTSSLSVNNKNNLHHPNYKTSKKKNFHIPMPKKKIQNNKILKTQKMKPKIKIQLII